MNTISYAAEAAEKYGNAKVYVLDDGKDERIFRIAEEYEATYITRPTNELRKAGNLRNAFSKTTGEFFLILDADFAVRSDILKTLVEHMYIDPNVAIVQSPQYFRVKYGQSWVEKGSGYIQELFYRLIQVNRNHWGAPICVGTNALYRRKALEPRGGTAPIGYSEDLHTGFYAMCDGWKVKYVPMNLATGLCPDSIKGFFNQQYRWCMGSFTLMLNPEFWRSPLSLMQKLCFISGMLYYVATGAGIIFNFLPSLIVLLWLPELAHVYNIAFSIPSLLVGTVFMAYWSKAKWGWYAPQTRQVSYWAHLFAIVDRLRGDLMPWVPTGQNKNTSRFRWFKNTFLGYQGLHAGLIIGAASARDWNADIFPMVGLQLFYVALSLRAVITLISTK